MKILIASDIHGSAYYCEKLLDAYKAEGAEMLLLLGDILYHGPRNDLPEKYAPKSVITMHASGDMICDHASYLHSAFAAAVSSGWVRM